MAPFEDGRLSSDGALLLQCDIERQLDVVPTTSPLPIRRILAYLSGSAARRVSY